MVGRRAGRIAANDWVVANNVPIVHADINFRIEVVDAVGKLTLDHELFLSCRMCDGVSQQFVDVLVRLRFGSDRVGVTTERLGQCNRHGRATAHALFAMADDCGDFTPVLLCEIPNLRCIVRLHEADLIGQFGSTDRFSIVKREK